MSHTIRTMVVGVATTAELDPVLPFALELAAAKGATLHVVHVFDLPEYLAGACARHPGLAGLAPTRPERFAAGVEARLCEQVGRFADRAAVRCHALTGSAAGRLAEFVAEVDADLLVVGATRRGRIVRNLLGTTAERVPGESPAPTLVFREPLFHGVRRVLLATDLSEMSAAACSRALDVVEALFGEQKPELRTVFAAETELLPGFAPESLALEDAARDELERFTAKLDTRGWRVSEAVLQGEPARELDREARAWKADLLVLGTHGRSWAARPRFGSVAAAAARGAGCDVLLVPAPAPAPGGLSPRAAAGVLAGA